MATSPTASDAKPASIGPEAFRSSLAMPADLLFALGFLLFVIAAAAMAYGIAKLDFRLLVAGGLTVGFIWLLAGWLNNLESTRYELVALELQPLDAVSGATVPDMVVESVDLADASPPSAYRLPSAATRFTDHPPRGIVAVYLVVELRVRGSLIEQWRNPAAHIEAVDQRLMFTAPGYQPLQIDLLEVLPAGWASEPIDRPPIKIRMHPAKSKE